VVFACSLCLASLGATGIPLEANDRTPFAGMEDAHTTLLKLDAASGNTFFAVFDGHGGSAVLLATLGKADVVKGSSIAKYAGHHVAERLASDPAYREGDYRAALKKAFLGTDEDLRAGVLSVSYSHSC